VEYSVATQKDIESCGIAPEYDRMLHDTIPVLYIQPVKKGKAGVDAVRNALINVFINEHKSEETNLPSKCVITYELPYNHNGKVDLFKITTSKPKGQTYTINPVRKDGKLINVRLELPNNPFGFVRVGVPEELQQDVDTYLSRYFRFGQNDDKNKSMSPLMGCNPMSLVNMVMSQDEGKKPSLGCNPRRPEKKKKETEKKQFRPFMPLMGCNPMNALRPLPGCNPRKKTK
jgi:hypothetical protein